MADGYFGVTFIVADASFPSTVAVFSWVDEQIEKLDED